MSGFSASLRVLPPAGVRLSFVDIVRGLQGTIEDINAVERFHAAIRQRFGTKYCFTVASGRAALSLLLQAMHRLAQDRDEVLLPAFTSFSVPSAVVNAGLKVGLYDLDCQTLSPDIDSLRGAITPRTLCIVVCHLFGYPCDMDTIKSVASEQNIPVVDDAAQAMGATYRGRAVGTLGTAGIFSLSRGKNITAVDGGIIVADRDDLASALKSITLPDRPEATIRLFFKALLLSIFLRPSVYGIPISLPFSTIGASIYDPIFPIAPFTPFQAGIAASMLARLDRINIIRSNKANQLVQRIGEKGEGRLIKPVNGARPVYLRLPWKCVGAGCEFTSLGIGRSYPLPLNEITELRQSLLRPGESFSTAKFLAESLITLPTHEFVTDQDQEGIVNQGLLKLWPQ